MPMYEAVEFLMSDSVKFLLLIICIILLVLDLVDKGVGVIHCYIAVQEVANLAPTLAAQQISWHSRHDLGGE